MRHRVYLRNSLILLGSHCETPSVAVRPGAMQLTLILWGPNTQQRDFVKFITPALAAP